MNTHHAPRTTRSLWLELLLIATLTALAAFLRYYQIEQVPPGFNSDEAVGAVGALETLRHGLRLYYAGQGGGGALGFYVAAISFALFGPGVATIRGTAAFAGTVSVLVTYFATREMFRSTTGPGRARLLAALAALGLATSLWHTQSSRVAFAAIGVPFLQVPGNYFLWRGLNTGRRVHFVVSGIFLASLMYIYLSGSFAPFVYLVFFLLQWLLATQKSQISNLKSPVLLKQHFRNLAICAGVAFVLFLPMLYFYLTTPELAAGRAQQAIFTNPLINKGDPWGTLWRSFWGNLAAFGLSITWFQGRPPANLILPAPVSWLFLLGLGISLWRVRRPPYLFTLVAWAIMLVPSILSPDSIPHTLRAVGAAPAAYTLVAVGVMGLVEAVLAIGDWALQIVNSRQRPISHQPSAISHQLSAIRYGLSALVLLVLALVVVQPVYAGFHYYMIEWPKTNDARAAYHVYAVDLAAEMSKETNPRATFLLPRNTAAGDVNPNYTVMFFYTGQAGYAWVVDDETTLEATLNDAVRGRDMVHVVRWKTSKHTGADPKEIIRYYLEKHGKFVETRSFEYYDIETYKLDQAGPDLTDGPLTPASVDFGGQLALTGYAFGDASSSGPVDAPSVPAGDLLPSVPAGDLLWARLRFRLTAASAEDLKASVTVTDSAGHVVGLIDKLLFNNILHQGTTQWAPGTATDAYFLVPINPATAPGDYRLNVAVYGAASLARLATPSGDSAQAVCSGTVAIRPDLSPPSADVLGLSQALNQPVTDGLTLVGFATTFGETLRPGERASLALVWRADAPLADDYRAALWATRGEDAWPLTGPLPLAGIDYPSGRWAAGQVVRGWFDGRVPPDMASGDYGLVVRITDSAQAQATQVPLGKLRVQGWPRRFDVPPMQTSVGANFAGQIELLGYGLHTESNPPGIVLYWRALSAMDVSYVAFVHLLDRSGQVVGQVDRVPGDGAFPTTGWLPGEIITDSYQLPLTGAATNSATTIEIGLYDPATGKRLALLDQAGSPLDDKVLLPIPTTGAQ